MAAQDRDDLERSGRAQPGQARHSLHGRVRRVGSGLPARRHSRDLRRRSRAGRRPEHRPTGPGHPDRLNGQAPGVERVTRVRHRALGHPLIGSVIQPATRFNPPQSDCSWTTSASRSATRCKSGRRSCAAQPTTTNVLVQLDFLHHTAWEDVDEVGRGASAMLTGHSERHIWGLGYQLNPGLFAVPGQLSNRRIGPGECVANSCCDYNPDVLNFVVCLRRIQQYIGFR